MYIIIISIIVGVIFLFYNTLIGLASQAQTGKLNNKSITIWFYGLLIINIIIASAIHLNKYYVENYQLSGNRGPKGYGGSTGKPGENTCAN